MAVSDAEMLELLEQAKLDLATGRQVREVHDSDGTIVKYNWTDMATLDKEIARLKNKQQTTKRNAIGTYF